MKKALGISSKDVLGSQVLLQAPIHLFDDVYKLRILAEYPKDLLGDVPEENSEDAGITAESKSAHEVKYELEGVWDGFDSSTGLVNRNTWSIAELIGLDIEIGRPVYSDYLGNIGNMKYGETFPVTLELEVEDTPLPAGQYRLRYSISDMLDRSYHTDFFYLTWDGERAVFTEEAHLSQ